MSSHRLRRYTPNGAAVLAVLMQQDNCVMSIQHTADEAEMPYGTAYRILERFLHEGLVSRQERTGDNNRAKLYYRLTPRGRGVAQRILQYMPNPIEALTAWLVQEGPRDATDPPPPRRVVLVADRWLGACAQRYREVGGSCSTAVTPNVGAGLVKGVARLPRPLGGVLG